MNCFSITSNETLSLKGQSSIDTYMFGLNLRYIGLALWFLKNITLNAWVDQIMQCFNRILNYYSKVSGGPPSVSNHNWTHWQLYVSALILCIYENKWINSQPKYLNMDTVTVIFPNEWVKERVQNWENINLLLNIVVVEDFHTMKSQIK